MASPCAWCRCPAPTSSTARTPPGAARYCPGPARVAVEAGVTDGWRKYVGLDGEVIGLDRFGESAPAGELFAHFGITAEAVVAAVKRCSPDPGGDSTARPRAPQAT